VPKEATQFWSDETRWMAGQLGAARDLDVFIDEGLGAIRGILPLPGERRMLALAERHRELAYQDVNAMLDSERYARFKAEFPGWVERRAWEEASAKQKQWNRLFSDVVPFARKLLDRLERRVLEAGSHVDKHDADQMHQLRIECKKLRYGAEFFVPVIKGLDDFIGHMKGLQDLLGVMNDVAVMKQLLDRLLEQETDQEVLQYAGGLVGWRTRQYHELLGSFDERWDEFTHAKHPWWSKGSGRNPEP
jgi:CHAD domain-containing protein